MTTDRQIEANKRNARRSTGPRTPKGKAASRGNAATHGLTARTILLTGEDPEEYRRLREGVIAQLKPEGVLEHELVGQIVNFLWRQRRVPAFEAALLAVLEQEQGEEESYSPGGFLSYEAAEDEEEGEEVDLKLGRTIKAFLSADFSGKLSRYETGIQKQLPGLLQELRIMQNRRLEEAKSEKEQAQPA